MSEPSDSIGDMITNSDLKLFSEEEKEKDFLCLGVGSSEGDKHFYYGKFVSGRTVLILDNRRVLQNNEAHIKVDGRYKTIGENQIRGFIEYTGTIGDISPRWSNHSIQSFIQGEVVDRREVYDSVYERLDYFMEFGLNRFTPAVQSCWTIATYLYPLFYWFPHLLINGPSGSGKSKNGYILKEMSFGGFDLGASAGATPPQIFRTLEGNRGTILIDEFEKQEKGPSSDTQQLVYQVLNASAARDAYVIRTEKIDGRWQAWKFPIFSPKIAANITGINPTSLRRFIVCHLIKSKGEKSKRKPQRELEKKKLNEVRDKLHIWAMQYWPEVKETYDTLDIGMSAGEEDNWLPILAVAKVIGNDVYGNVKSFIDLYQELEVDTGNIEADFFLTLLDSVDDVVAPYTAKQISEFSGMGDILPQLGLKSPDRWIGKTLTNYKFKSKHKSRGATYYLSRENVKQIVDLFFNPNKTSETSLTSYTSLISETSQLSASSEANNNKYNPDVSDVSDLLTGWSKANPPSEGRCAGCGEDILREWNYGGNYYCRECYRDIGTGVVQ